MEKRNSYLKFENILVSELQKVVDFCEENEIEYKELYIYDLEQRLSQLQQEKEELLKYKKCWEYMFEWFNKRNAKRDTPKSLEIENFVIEFMKEIEKMNGIEVE